MARLIGVFGGTFDPPHIGHLILASEAYHQLHLDRLLWVLTPTPPHKLEQRFTSVELRLEMVQATIDANSAFELSRVEIDRPGPHYALETVEKIRVDYPESELVYVMGGDSLRDLPNWSRPTEFVQACDAIGVMCRPGQPINLTELERTLPGLSAKVRFIDTPLLEISSRQIRKRIASGAHYRYYLHPEVYKLIQTHQLYRKAPSST